MSITFACPCGKEFTVAPTFAGKRTKCPKCAEPLYVPTPVLAGADDDDETSAYALLSDGDDEPIERPLTTRQQTWNVERPATPPKPKISPMAQAAAQQREKELRKAAKAASDYHRGNDERSGLSLSPAVLGGLLGMIGFGAWFFIGLAMGYIFFYPPIGFFFSLIGFVGGLFGYEGDD